MREGRKTKRTDIQALRAIAVLAVVVYHLWPDRLTGGFMGVDIFFVISGYLMTLTLLKHIDPVVLAKNKIRATFSYISEFYARRIKRLIPAASATLLGVLGLIVATGNLSIIEKTAQQIVASALFAQNWFLSSQAVDYLASAERPTAVQHFWSLSLEEQFYLVWPLLLLGISLLSVHIAVIYKSRRISGAIIPTVFLAVGLFLYGYWLTKTDPASAYFVTHARAWELLAGGVIAFLPKLRSHDLKLLLPWIGTAMIVYALYKWDGVGFPGWHALIPVLGTVFIIYGGSSTVESKASFTRLLRARPIQWIGDVSYSLYLWHWPLIILVPVLFALDINGAHGTYIKLGILAGSFILAWLSYKFIEQPTQKISLKKRWIYLSFVALVAIVVGSGLLVANRARADISSRLSTLHSVIQSDNSTCIGAKAIDDRNNCKEGFEHRDTRFEQIGPMDRFTNVIRTGQDCEVYHPTAHFTPDPTMYCAVGDINARKTVAIWGDSHASHWINTFDQIGQKNHIKFIILSSGQCGGMQANAPECKDRIGFIRDSNLLNDVDAIIISLWFRYPGDSHAQPTNIAIQAVQSLSDRPIYLLEDIPVPGSSGDPDCLVFGKSCKNDRESALWAIKSVSERVITDKLLPESSIIPTDDLFCGSDYCYSYIGGIPVYNSYSPIDDTRAAGGNAHMTGSYSYSLADLLEKKLRRHNIIPS